MGLLYMPYALALVAVRCPTEEQHAALLGHLSQNPDDALGNGYIVPRGGEYILPKVPSKVQPSKDSTRELQQLPVQMVHTPAMSPPGKTGKVEGADDWLQNMR